MLTKAFASSLGLWNSLLNIEKELAIIQNSTILSTGGKVKIFSQTSLAYAKKFRNFADEISSSCSSPHCESLRDANFKNFKQAIT